MLKVAIVGCGKIADDHMQVIRRIPNYKVVGLCDREPLMAQQLGERFGVSACFADPEELLRKTNPDVVHITTPPQTHFELAKLCLERGCHIYVEKPFTVNSTEAACLIEMAEQRDRKVTVGNDGLFRDAAIQFRKLVRQGFLGGEPLHIESLFCYHLDSTYAGALLGDQNHWVRRLPGKLLHNIISHGIVRIAEYVQDDDPLVVAHGFTSPLLRQLGETEIMDELRVMVSGRSGPTAYFTFSSQMRPVLHQLRVYGPENGLVLDDDDHTVIKLRGKRYKSYAQKFIPPVMFAGQYVANLKNNVSLFLHNDFHMTAGMKNLMEAFHRSITDNAPLPISYRTIVLTCKIMDAIFAQTEQQRIETVSRDEEMESVSIAEPLPSHPRDIGTLAPV
jgi:predicted dehydrogenase